MRGNNEPVFASPRQFRSLVAVVALSVALFGVEIAHYLTATDFGANDQMEAGANQDPRCEPLPGGHDFLCPFPGYNSIQMTCTARGCGDRNLNLPPTTDADRRRTDAMELSDKVSSLKVEAPYSRTDPDWQHQAAWLRAGGDWYPLPVEVSGHPKSMEEAQRVTRARSQDVARRVAKEWLDGHER